jgi:hypothetical protein
MKLRDFAKIFTVYERFLSVTRRTRRARRIIFSSTSCSPSKPGELPPKLLTEPYVTVSRHTALLGAFPLRSSVSVDVMFKHLADPFAPDPLQFLHSSYESVRPAFPLRYFHPREVFSLVAFRLTSGLRFPRSHTTPIPRSCLLSAGSHWRSLKVTLQLFRASRTSSLLTPS